MQYFSQNTNVVYFDQQMHACACVGMVENDQKHLKMIKLRSSLIILACPHTSSVNNYLDFRNQYALNTKSSAIRIS